MRRKHLLALGALVLAAALAGCGFGSSEIPEDQLNEQATYDWDTSADATFNISRSSYATVVNVSNETVEVWQRDAIEGDNPVNLRALQYRYENGTVVNASHGNLSATRDGDKTQISVPEAGGKVAYTASRSGKQFSTPVFIEGSHEVILPPGARVGIPLLSQVSPGNWNSTVENDRMTVRWGNLSDETINTRYYLERDLLIFAALAIIALLVGTVGGLYYFRQIRGLESQREEIDIDIDYDDDDFGDDGPPPGM
ncbi:DUF5803 family protein [Salinibaculum salinum]|uniref:DUF5803 family protein n=1 Tax=Salinibaculum salinum TaxID=3131996 RepID=UPI0030EBCB2D